MSLRGDAKFSVRLYWTMDFPLVVTVFDFEAVNTEISTWKYCIKHVDVLQIKLF